MFLYQVLFAENIKPHEIEGKYPCVLVGGQVLRARENSRLSHEAQRRAQDNDRVLL